MKILLVTHYYAEHKGGIEIVAKNIAERMVSCNDCKILWCASNTVLPKPSKSKRIKKNPMPSSNIAEDILQIPYPIWSFSSYLNLWKQLKNFDIVHLHDFFYLSNFLAFFYAKILKKPVVITQHIGFVPYKNKLLRILLNLTNSMLGRIMLQRAEQVVFISDVIKDYFTNKFDFPIAPRFIPNGVDLAIFTPCSDLQRIELRKKISLDDSKIGILFVGRFVEKKGLHIIRALVESFQDVQWLFAGWGPMDPETWRLPNIQVFRELQGSNLASLYQAVDLLILPSVGEGFPLVIQEAMACGTPVLTNIETAHAHPEVVDYMFSEKVFGPERNKETIEIWEKNLKKILSDPKKLSKMRQKVSTYARKTWSWDTCADEYIKLFQNLMKR